MRHKEIYGVDLASILLDPSLLSPVSYVRILVSSADNGVDDDDDDVDSFLQR